MSPETILFAVGIGMFAWTIRGMIKPRPITGNVLVIGDSLVDSPGLKQTLREIMPGVVNLRSFSGSGTRDIHTATIEEILRLRPSTVVVLAGVNDLASGRGLDATKRFLDELYTAILDRGILVVGVELLPWEKHHIGRAMQAETRELNAWIRRNPKLTAVVRTQRITGQRSDGLHLTVDGGKQLAFQIRKEFP